MKLAAAWPSSAAQGGDQASDMAHSVSRAVAWQQRTDTPYKVNVADQDCANVICAEKIWR